LAKIKKFANFPRSLDYSTKLFLEIKAEEVCELLNAKGETKASNKDLRCSYLQTGQGV
jgi:hypothetical protein